MLKGIEIDKGEYERELIRKHNHFIKALNTTT